MILNAVDAAERGSEIRTRTEFLSAQRRDGVWEARLAGGRSVSAEAIVNAAGPWVADVLQTRLSKSSKSRVRLIKGSHIVVPRLSEGEDAYILQQPDGRVVFALPYGAFTLVGTTDIPVESPEEAIVSAQEVDYLCGAVNLYFRRQTRAEDMVWSYSGVRSLYDDGAREAKAVTRDYHLELDELPGPKLLSVFGGEITTARALAEEALDRLGIERRKATDRAPLPGGDIYPAFMDYLDELSAWMPAELILRLSRAYGTRLRELLKDARRLKDLGRHFGTGLYEAEVRYLMGHEFARTADDILWRRTKVGLHMKKAEQQAFAAWMERHGPS